MTRVGSLLANLLPDRPWTLRALCVGDDPDEWFPDRVDDPAEHAMATCARCPVRVECAAAGITERYGIWGGTRPRSSGRLRVSAA